VWGDGGAVHDGEACMLKRCPHPDATLSDPTHQGGGVPTGPPAQCIRPEASGRRTIPLRDKDAEQPWPTLSLSMAARSLRADTRDSRPR